LKNSGGGKNRVKECYKVFLRFFDLADSKGFYHIVSKREFILFYFFLRHVYADIIECDFEKAERSREKSSCEYMNFNYIVLIRPPRYSWER